MPKPVQAFIATGGKKAGLSFAKETPPAASEPKSVKPDAFRKTAPMAVDNMHKRGRIVLGVLFESTTGRAPGRLARAVDCAGGFTVLCAGRCSVLRSLLPELVAMW